MTAPDVIAEGDHGLEAGPTSDGHVGRSCRSGRPRPGSSAFGRRRAPDRDRAAVRGPGRGHAAERLPDAASAPAPRDFRGKGKWIVRDLGITVPFTWQGRDGDSQMTAGGPQYPIWFTNLIYRDTLYTLTYKWPGLNEHPCSRIPGFNLEALNQGFENARFVGPETLRRTRSGA